MGRFCSAVGFGNNMHLDDIWRYNVTTARWLRHQLPEHLYIDPSVVRTLFRPILDIIRSSL
mgnify:CR=1 FL=1